MKFDALRLMSLLLALSLTAACDQASAQDAGTRTITVLSPVHLTAALRITNTPTVFRLAQGEYPPIVIENSTVPLWFTAENPNAPPEILGLEVHNSTDLSFENLVFDFRFETGTDEIWASAFRFENAQRLRFNGITVDGALMAGTGTDGDGYPAGRGLHFERTQDVEISDSIVQGFWVGLSVANSHNFTLRESYLHGMRKDVVTLTQVRDVVIEGNYFGAFNRSFAFDDHPDMIQMWTGGTTQPSERVSVRQNVFNSGHGPWSQTIFFRNERVDKGEAGRAMFYRDIEIEQNLVLNAHANGIYAGETDTLTISNNILIRNRNSEENGMSDTLASPRVHVAQDSEHVTIVGNAAYHFPAPSQNDWKIQTNTLVQNARTTLYDDLFAETLNSAPSSFNPVKLPGLDQTDE